MRRARIAAVWLVVVVAAASAVSCTRVVDLMPDASMAGGWDGGVDAAWLGDAGFAGSDAGFAGSDGGLGGSDGGLVAPDGGPVGDAAGPDAL